MSDNYGFELIGEQDVNEIQGRARLWRHAATGAEVLSVCCEEENKVFGICFRTPPRDSTGVSHILEHSVLCGSRKYPLKEPFVELLKSSLQTFLNAFTFPDKTCYPVASANVQDFYNLIDVYLDAVFHPLLGEKVFKQEGWHYELNSPEEPLTIKGVVYNEMKGAYSSPDSVLHEFSQRSLFPDNTYGLDSGGEPEAIPELDYASFEDFHARYYHPSNARVFFYGDDDEDARLAKLAEYLDEYEAREPDSEVEEQPRLGEPMRLTMPFAAGEDDKHMFTVNWLLPDTLDRKTVLAMHVLEHVLIGLPSSVLRRELIESGLGEDLAGVGLEDDIRQMFFSIGLKGVEREDLDKAEALVFDVLRRVADEGPHPHAVEAALNSIEFDLREMNAGRFPRGLALMLRSLTTWLYDADPLDPLAWQKDMDALKAEAEQGVDFLRELVRGHFLDNTHRSTLVLEPDTELSARREAAEAERLEQVKRDLSPREIQALAMETEDLMKFQAREDSPEDLARIPHLEIDDLPREETPIPSRESGKQQARLLFHDLPTRGIVYLDLGLDMRVLPEEYLPLAPLFGRALFEMGTKKDGLFGLNMRIARKTGGIGAYPYTASALGTDEPVARLFIRGKAMAENGEDMLEIVRDVLLDTRFDNKERFRRMILEEKARMEQRMIPAGHAAVMSRLRAGSGAAGWAAERMSGVSGLFSVRELVRKVEDDWPSVLDMLEEMRRLLLCRPRMMVNVTMEGSAYGGFEPALDAMLEVLPSEDPSEAEWSRGGGLPKHEGLVVPARVNYVGKGLDLAGAGYEFNGAHLACVKHARMAFLWDRVRVQGGAYGAFCSLDRFSGSLIFASYRDPNLGSTLRAFDDAVEYFKGVSLDRAALEKSVIGAMGDVDAYMLPDAKGFASMARELTGDTPEVRRKMREELLSAGQENFRNFGEAMARALDTADVVVLGSEESLKASPVELTRTRVL